MCHTQGRVLSVWVECVRLKPDCKEAKTTGHALVLGAVLLEKSGSQRTGPSQ